MVIQEFYCLPRSNETVSRPYFGHKKGILCLRCS
uniref:Uncharacterized protein n=1 Tax=Anguilla anguilla TaxID=7936 RepID=A0A0E9S2P5_ANGAN